MKFYYKSRYCSTLFHLFGLIWDDLVPFHPRSCLFVLVPVCSSLFRFFVRFNNITLESQASEDSYHEFLFDLYHWITPLNPFRNQGYLSQRSSTSSSAEHHGHQNVWGSMVLYDSIRIVRTWNMTCVWILEKNTKGMISTHCLLMFISFLNNLR